jgi:hypothetical protein
VAVYHVQVEIRKRGGQQMLISLLGASVPQLAETAMWALWKCAFQPEEEVDATLRAGIVPALVRREREAETARITVLTCLFIYLFIAAEPVSVAQRTDPQVCRVRVEPIGRSAGLQ